MEFSICGRLLATAGQDSVVVSHQYSFQPFPITHSL